MIDEAIDRLITAYESARLPPIRPADHRAAELLARIREEICPLQLPEQLETLWSRIDPASISVAPYPAPMPIDIALHAWVTHRNDFPGLTPRLLFPFGYESRSYLLVELDAPNRPGGACLSWSYGGEPFRVRFPDLASYIDLLAAMIDQREFVRHYQDGSEWHQFDPDRLWDTYQAARLATMLPLPGFGHTIELDEDVARWPDHWLAADRLVPAEAVAPGAVVSIAELLDAAAGGSAVTGTIKGHVAKLIGSRAGRRVEVSDGTGTLDVWCPASVCCPALVIRRTFEFDVVVQPGHVPPPEFNTARVTEGVDGGTADLAEAQAAVAELFRQAFETTAQAEATGVRAVG